MIDDIKIKLNNLKGKKIKISIDVGRNKMETYSGFIDNMYQSIWTFRTDVGIKSFSYKDILINNVIIGS